MFGYKLKYPRWMAAILRRSCIWRHLGETHHRALKFGAPNQVWRRKISLIGGIKARVTGKQSVEQMVNRLSLTLPITEHLNISNLGSSLQFRSILWLRILSSLAHPTPENTGESIQRISSILMLENLNASQLGLILKQELIEFGPGATSVCYK